MPCQDTLVPTDNPEYKEMKRRLDEATRLLCGVMRSAVGAKGEQEGQIPVVLRELRAIENGDLGRWWDRHQQEDAERISKLRARALAKLSPEEISALFPEGAPKVALRVGQRVRTLQDTKPTGYERGARSGNVWGMTGRIAQLHTGHGMCYQVQHDDGSTGMYEPEELEVV